MKHRITKLLGISLSLCTTLMGMDIGQQAQKPVTINIKDLVDRFDDHIQRIVREKTDGYTSCTIYVDSAVKAEDLAHIFDLLPPHLSYTLHFHENCYRFNDYYTKGVLNSVVAPQSAIKSLKLQHIGLEPGHVKIISDFLKTNTTLTSLDLDCNHVKDEGAADLADALTVNTTLTFLGLRYNRINDKGAIAIAKALDHNKTLTSLNLSCEEWDATGITDGGVYWLGNALVGNKTLLSLNLGTNKNITPVGIELLMQTLMQGECALTHLDLDGCQFTDACATLFGQMLKVNTTLTHLNIGGGYSRNHPMNTKPILEALKVNQSLIALNITGHKLEITNDENDPVHEALVTHPTLSVLDFGACRLGNQLAITLADRLKSGNTLTTVNVTYNDIDNSGIKPLAEQLANNTTVTELNLQGNHIDDEGAAYLGGMLSTNTTLSKLNLYHNKISKKGIEIMLNSLKFNQTLSYLDFTSQKQRLDELEIYALINMLEDILPLSTNITYIGLTGNGCYKHEISLKERVKSITEKFLPARKITIGL